MKLLDILKESLGGKLTQDDIDILDSKGFEVTKTKHNLFWIERKYGIQTADWRYLNNLLKNKQMPFKIEYWRGEGDKGRSKEIWIDKKYLG